YNLLLDYNGDDNNRRLEWDDTPGTGFLSSNILSRDKWIHYCETIDASGLTTFYVDGTSVGSKTYTYSGENKLCFYTLGCSSWPDRHGDLWIDEAIVTSSTIPTSTVQALYNNGAGSEACTTPGCD